VQRGQSATLLQKKIAVSHIARKMSGRTQERLHLHAPVDTSQSLGLLSPAPAEASKVELSLPNFSWNATERIVPVWPLRGALMVPVPTLKKQGKKGER
jgi:hypothetical protein